MSKITKSTSSKQFFLKPVHARTKRTKRTKNNNNKEHENKKYNKYYALRNDAIIKNNSNNPNNNSGATDQPQLHRFLSRHNDVYLLPLERLW